jgi:hypothetical protein
LPQRWQYFALFVQLDAYAAKRNLKGMPESELPTFRQTFAEGMTVTACYIFLAIVLAPALVQSGLDPLAVHLFILYIAGLGAIQDGAPGYAMRIMLAIGGLALAAPGVQSLGLSNLETAAIALLIAAPTLVVTFLQNRRAVPA